jgi:hypothetical protein
MAAATTIALETSIPAPSMRLTSTAIDRGRRGCRSQRGHHQADGDDEGYVGEDRVDGLEDREYHEG